MSSVTTGSRGAVIEAAARCLQWAVRPRRPILPLAECCPVEAERSIELGGEVVSSGNGAACLGDPLTAKAEPRAGAEIGAEADGERKRSDVT
jgi:hypothetical protein